MASTSILLANPKAETSSIVCQLRDGRSVKIKITSGISVKTKHWSVKNYVLSADHSASTKNNSLKKLKDRVLGIYLEAKSKGLVINAEYIREELRPKEKVNPKNVTFWNAWEVYLQEKKAHFGSKSFEKFHTLKSHFIDFEDKSKAGWRFDLITEARLELLQGFFHDKGLNNQTTSKYIGFLKMFLNWAVKNKYTDNVDFKNFSPIREKETLKVALSSEEVQAIRNADLKGKKSLENVRKLFILSTLTGLRYSDYSRVKAEHLKSDEGRKILQIRQQKTGELVELPLTVEGEAIIQDLIDGIIHPISNQKMNEYVKELCKLAKINDPFEVHNFKGKLVVTKTKPKYDLVSTHTGRRTFATNLLLQGVPAETVMKYTGHRDMVSFSKYVNIPKKTERDMVRNALNKMSIG